MLLLSPKLISKTQNGHFTSKIALRLKKVCYKVSLREKCRRQSCKAFIGLRCQLVLITNKKSHTSCQLIPSSMTLNDFERRNSPYYEFSPNSIALLANYATLFEDRPILSVKYCLIVPVFYFWPKLAHPAARSLCDS